MGGEKKQIICGDVEFPAECEMFSAELQLEQDGCVGERLEFWVSSLVISTPMELSMLPISVQIDQVQAPVLPGSPSTSYLPARFETSSTPQS